MIVTAEFREAADVARRSQGAPDFPYVDVPHPINTRSDAELARFADGVVDSIVRVLTQG